MIALIVAYVGGVLTILSPCILPVLPFVLARADRPFRSHGLPQLSGMALAFAGVATLATLGGAWVVSASEFGRAAAIMLLALFGATLMFPALAVRFSRPLVALGTRMSAMPTTGRPAWRAMFSPLMLGIGTGLLWAPCAGPILGSILTGAALNGANAGTSLLLVCYAAGACTSLAAALLFSGRLLSVMKRSFAAGEVLRRAAGAAVVLAAAAIAFNLDTRLLSRLPSGAAVAMEQALVASLPAALARPPGTEGVLAPLAGATEWINAVPQTSEGLRGKVVLIDFWTYSCINCLRTIPYLRAWAEKYKDAGLVVIGVHSPEFAFERSPSNVRQAVKDLGIGFPVAVDSEFAIWRAFGNQSWPAFYFVDRQGRIRHHHFGEGRYEESERVIQQLLAESGQPMADAGLVAPRGEGTLAPAGASPPRSGETYIGYERAQNFASPAGVARDRSRAYESPAALRVNQWSLAGDWTVRQDHAMLDRANGRIAHRFHARDLHLVLGPAADGKPVRFRIFVDGKAPLADHGTDVDAQGVGTIDRQRLYQLVRQPGPAQDRLFEIEFLDPGAQAYAFTFG